MSEETLIHWIEILAGALVTLAAAAAAWIKHLQNAHIEGKNERIEDLKEQLRRELEEDGPKSRGPRSSRLVTKEIKK